jgi:hypothetical protein
MSDTSTMRPPELVKSNSISSIDSAGDMNLAMKGLLHKKRNGFAKLNLLGKTWEYRFFMLSVDGILSYYEMGTSPLPSSLNDTDDQKARGSINLKERKFTLISEPLLDSAPTAFALEIDIEGEENWCMCADAENDYKMWCLEIENFVKHPAVGTVSTPNRKRSIFNFGSDPKKTTNDNLEHEDDYHQQTGASKNGNMNPNTNSYQSNTNNSRTNGTNGNSQSNNNNNNPNPSPSRKLGASRRLSSSKGGAKGKGSSGLKLNKKASASYLNEMLNTELLLTIAIFNTCMYFSFLYYTNPPSLPQSMKLPFMDDLIPSILIPITNMISESILSIILIALSYGFGVPTNFFTSARMLSVIYFVTGNVVVIMTLLLRGRRAEKEKHEKEKAEVEKSQVMVTAALGVAPTPRPSIKAAALGGVNLGKEVPKTSGSAKNSIAVKASITGGSGGGVGIVPQEPVSTLDEEEEAGLPMIDGKPIAGSTLEEVTEPQRLAPEHTWSKIDHSDFNVRIGPNYSYHKKKAPSPPALYDAFAVDVFCSHTRMDHATPKFHLPDEYTSIDTHDPYVPPIMVVQIQIPAEEPPLFVTVDDGPGWCIMMYFKISDQTREELKDISTASPAVKLWVSVPSSSLTSYSYYIYIKT